MHAYTLTGIINVKKHADFSPCAQSIDQPYTRFQLFQLLFRVFFFRQFSFSFYFFVCLLFFRSNCVFFFASPFHLRLKHANESDRINYNTYSIKYTSRFLCVWCLVKWMCVRIRRVNVKAILFFLFSSSSNNNDTIRSWSDDSRRKNH